MNPQTLQTVFSHDKPTMLPSQIQNALGLVRCYQLMQFNERLKHVSPKKRASIEAVEAALDKHGSKIFTYKTRLDTLVLLSGLLSTAPLADNCPEIDQIRLNFCVGIANAVNAINPILAAIALGEIETKHHMPVRVGHGPGR